MSNLLQQKYLQQQVNYNNALMNALSGDVYGGMYVAPSTPPEPKRERVAASTSPVIEYRRLKSAPMIVRPKGNI